MPFAYCLLSQSIGHVPCPNFVYYYLYSLCHNLLSPSSLDCLNGLGLLDRRLDLKLKNYKCHYITTPPFQTPVRTSRTNLFCGYLSGKKD